MQRERTLIATVLIVLGVLALIAGIIYFTVEAKSLPSFLGSIHGATGHRTKRGVAGVIIGAVLLLAGIGVFAYRPRS